LDRPLTPSALDERYRSLVARSDALQGEWQAALRVVDAHIAHARTYIASVDEFLAKQAAIERETIDRTACAKPLSTQQGGP
jgi:hypothetical protein